MAAGFCLPSVIAALGGAEVTATDWYADALAFVAANADQAGTHVETRSLDWNDPPSDLVAPGNERDVVIGADLLYEPRNGPALAALLPRVVRPGGHALIADPRRPHADGLLTPLIRAGWGHDMREIRHHGRQDESGPVIHLHRLTAPGR